MDWEIVFDPEFSEEVREFDSLFQDDLAASLVVLAAMGPRLGRPHVDTLKGSAFANMKELRFTSGGGIWRVAFAFDPKRQAVILTAGDKAGVAKARFYRQLIVKADRRYAEHLGRARRNET